MPQETGCPRVSRARRRSGARRHGPAHLRPARYNRVPRRMPPDALPPGAMTDRLPQTHPERTRLRRRAGVAAGARRRTCRRASGNRVLLKREDMQPVFSFKLRGAYNKMAQPRRRRTLARGVICASAGNHAQGVALAAQPARLPRRDRDAGHHAAGEDRRRPGARRRGRCCTAIRISDAYRARAERCRRPRASPSSIRSTIPDVIAGQGTIGMEILRQHQAPIDAIFVAIGGGGLIAGIAAYVKQVRPDIRIIGVQTFDSDAMALSLAAGEARRHWPTSACSPTAPRSSGSATRPSGSASDFVDDIVLVDTDAICAAIKDVFEDTPRDPRARRRAGGRRHEGLGATARPACATRRLIADRLRRQHELRPPALRLRARRGRRAARGGVRRDHSRGARQLPALLRAASGRATSPNSTTGSPTASEAHVFVGMQIAGHGEAARDRADASSSADSRRST